MNRLEALAKEHGSDKFGHHDYCRHYHEHFAEFQEAKVKVLELGIGGYEYPDRGGSGLRMWSDYFKRGNIFGIDVYDKSKISLPARTKIFQGSQSDGDFLQAVMNEIGATDIIIDDASHMNRHTILSFKHLYPWLKPGGYYVIEDIESSWWNEGGFDGHPDGFNFDFSSTINFCRGLVNNLNAPRYLPEHYASLPLNQYPIDAIHFYANLVIFKKK